MSFLPAFAAIAALTMPRIALACPYCAMGNDGNGVAQVVILGSMIAFPFLLLPPVMRLIRKGGKDLPY